MPFSEPKLTAIIGDGTHLAGKELDDLLALASLNMMRRALQEGLKPLAIALYSRMRRLILSDDPVGI